MHPPLDLEGCLREHGSGLRQLARALLSRADAEDAVQEVWLEMLRAPPQLTRPLGGWLRTVLQHIAWRSRRGERRRRAREATVAHDRDSTAENPVEVIAHEERAHELVSAIAALDPVYRDVIWQRFFEGLPPRAIAAKTGVPVTTVKSRLLRGLALLRERLGDERASDWRAGLAGAFGLGRNTTVSTNAATWWPGVWWMAAGAKIGAAAVGAAIALAAWWSFGSVEITPPRPLTRGTELDVAMVAFPLDDVARVAADVASPSIALAPPAAVADSATAEGVAHVLGRVIDARTQEPLVGAMVRWNCDSQLSPSPTDPGATTDADGRFNLQVPADTRTRTVIAAADGYVRRWSSVGGLRAGQVDDLGTATLRRGRCLPVRVIDADSGVGVEGAMLEFRFDHQRASRWHETIATMKSEADGTCTSTVVLPFAACTLALLAGEHDLLSPTSIDVAPTSPVDVTVTVRRRATIRGVVVDEAGAPLAGIGLSMSGGLSPEATTATDGTFTLVRRRPGDGAVTLSFTETGTMLPPAPVADVPWGTNGLRIELLRPKPLPIEVIDDRGSPVEHFAIALGRAATGHLLRQRGHHEGGRLEVEGVAPGQTSLRVVPLDIEWAPSEGVPLADVAPVQVVVVRRTPCRVLVTRGGAPVVDALVEYVNERLPLTVQHRTVLNDPRDRAAPVAPMWPELVAAARTGSDGIASLWRDRSQVGRAVRVQVGDAPHVLVREPAFAADGSPLRIELPGAGAVRGRVILAGRAHTEVSVRFHAGEHTPHLTPQPDGSFTSPALPAGPCRVELLLRVGSAHAPVDGFVREVTIGGKEPANVEFDLGAMVTTTVRGRVVAGSPLPAGLAVDLVRITGQGVVTQGSLVGDDGTFAIDGLLPGTYLAAFRLAPSTAVFVPALQSEPIVLVGGEHVMRQLRFVRRKLTVRFVRPDGTPARGHRTLARCGGVRWPAMALFAPRLDETLVLDPAPALPIEFGGFGGAPWSEPVVVPTDRSEAEVTVVLRGP